MSIAARAWRANHDTLSLPSAKHAWKYNATFTERVVQRVRAIPGIEAVGAIRGLPMNDAPFNTC